MSENNADYKANSSQQKEEIQTIKKRTITLNLSDADCDRLSEKSGACGLMISELLENFIGDLVYGTYSNGSDECDLANQWLSRCGFSWMNENALLNYLFKNGYYVDDFLTAVDEQEYYDAHPDEYLEDTKGLHGANLWCEDDIEEVKKPYLQKYPDADFKKEIDLCRKWLNELQALKGELDEK